MPDPTEPNSGYWFADGDDARRRRAVDLLQAFRLYRAAEVAMRRRTRESMGMGENDLLVLRYLLKAQRNGQLVSPGELARYLAVSTASMTAIVDRLAASGHVRRERHATDRRSIYVIPTVDTDHEVRETLGGMHERMLSAVVDMSPEETSIVIECLERLQTAIDGVTPAPPLDEHA
ncbi:MarR family winged helix-turn-helix transcriptional regulator [Microbacterium sp. 18062]|uniref:MarR family winged helix-turn-helix transcriptional regulator n=1 Tax=Microbacterium sp. 18062 TaxID=2681410 RepID=UPI00135779CC|nr:MarR family transcriptional regulator [Microbacterium sp. 18062]